MALRGISNGQALLRQLETSKTIFAAHEIRILCEQFSMFDDGAYPNPDLQPAVLRPEPALEHELQSMGDARRLCERSIAGVKRTLGGFDSTVDRYEEYSGSQLTTRSLFKKEYVYRSYDEQDEYKGRGGAKRARVYQFPPPASDDGLDEADSDSENRTPPATSVAK